MFFRNLTLFRFPTTLDLAALDERLAEVPLKPVGPQEMSSRGFIAPFGPQSETLTHRVEDALWLTVGGEDRLLPSVVVNDLLARKLADIEASQGRKPGGRARKQMKEDLVHELLPRAFVRPTRTDAMLDLGNGLCIVDTSAARARAVGPHPPCTGSFPAIPLNAEVAGAGAHRGTPANPCLTAEHVRGMRSQGLRRQGRGREVPASGRRLRKSVTTRRQQVRGWARARRPRLRAVDDMVIRMLNSWMAHRQLEAPKRDMRGRADAASH